MLTKHAQPEDLLLAHPGGSWGVAEQFGHGRREPLGAPSTRAGLQPTSLPVHSSLAAFGGVWLK